MKFRAGELVSIGPIQGITIYGRVVDEPGPGRHTRLKVLIETGPRAGQMDWPDSPPWSIGAGAHESRCSECLRPFRTDHAADSFCPSCDAGDAAEIRAQGENPSRRSSSWEIHERERRARHTS